MATFLFEHPAFTRHRTGPGHPERPDRMAAVEAALQGTTFDGLVRRQAAEVDPSMAELAHPADWVERLVAAIPETELARIDADTVMSPGTLEAALRGIGGATGAVDAVMTGEAANAFVASRPPGHHAERERAMGFCFFNNAAIAARYAQRAHGAERVAIVDWDVHHGNGTQDILWSDASVLYASTHEWPLYPGTGRREERGDHDTIVNVPLAPGTDGRTFREAFSAAVLPRLDAFRPELVIVSAGFDAHRRDPLASLELEAADFAWATRAVMEVADLRSGGRVVSILEGGYDLDALGESVAAHVAALAGLSAGRP